MALEETIGALVARHGVDVIVGAFPTNQEAVVHDGRRATENCSKSRKEKQNSTVEFLIVQTTE